MNDTSSTNDIRNLIDDFNTLQEQAGYGMQIDVQASGTVEVILNDGGYVGSTYLGSIPHNLGYAPMFILYSGDASINQYRPLPSLQAFDGMGGNVHRIDYAYSDATNVYAAIKFYAPTINFGVTNNGPFYSAGTSYRYTYFILKHPIITN